MQAKRRTEIFFGSLDIFAGLLLLFLVWAFLPTRWAVVDVPGTILGIANFATGIALLVIPARARRFARVTALLTLGLGLAIIGLLLSAVGYMSAIYAPVGGGGMMTFGLAIVVLLPYLIVFPIAQLVFMRDA